MWNGNAVKWVALAIVIGSGLVAWGALSRDVSHNSVCIEEIKEKKDKINEKLDNMNRNIITICTKLELNCK